MQCLYSLFLRRDNYAPGRDDYEYWGSHHLPRRVVPNSTITYIYKRVYIQYNREPRRQFNLKIDVILPKDFFNAIID